jgi:hypothetical protein
MDGLLAIRLKFRGFKPGLGDIILRTITIRSRPSFGAEVTKETHVVRIYCL